MRPQRGFLQEDYRKPSLFGQKKNSGKARFSFFPVCDRVFRSSRDVGLVG
jgi:hypothetical protein